MSERKKHTDIILSIIIPVYNVEKYLEECLESVCNQNLQNYEVIIVNDGSTDNSEKIINYYVNKYSFLTKINQVNLGLGAARNIGITLAKGKYIGFVDSDDFIDKNMFVDMINIAENNNSDIVICNVEGFKDNNRNKKWYFKVEDKYYNKNLNVNEIIKLYLKSEIKGFAWNKLYRRKLFIDNKIQYIVGRYYEDIFTTLKLLSCSENTYIVDKIYYKYRKRNGNITSGISEKHLNDYNLSIKECKKFMEKNMLFDNLKEYKKAFEIISANASLKLYYKYSNYNIRKIYQNFNKNVSKYNYKLSIREILFSNTIDSKSKVIFILNKLRIMLIILKIKEYIKKLLIEF